MINADAVLKRKKVLMRAVAVFFGIMLVLTFFSSTLNNLGLTRVEAVMVRSGNLSYIVEGQANAVPQIIRDVYTQQSLRVKNVLVKKGQTVKKGQLLAQLDVEDIVKEIKGTTLDVEFKKTQMALASKKYDIDLKISMDKSLDEKKALATALELYKSGAETQVNIDNLKSACQAADNDYQKLLEQKAADIAVLQNELEKLNLNLHSLQAWLEKNISLLSPIDGYIWEINIQEGAFTSTAQPSFKIAGNGGFCAHFTVTAEEGKLLRVGDAITITIPSLNDKKLESKINLIENSKTISKALEVTALIDYPELKGGEMLSININKESGFYSSIIPNSAVFTDSSGKKFAYVIKERKSSLGKEFYLQKAFIYIAAANKNETAVASGLSSVEKVVTKSEKPVMSGDRVKLHRD